MLALCHALKDNYSLAAVTYDIFTREDGEFLMRHNALPKERIRDIETGGCPHAAIREDISANLQACENLTDEHDVQLLVVESGRAGGDKVPRKGGQGITPADLLVINKIDLAPHVGADLNIMDRDAKVMRGEGPTHISGGAALVAVGDSVVVVDAFPPVRNYSMTNATKMTGKMRESTKHNHYESVSFA
ncbi:hypothetical protein PsorP6_008417 [Peronosclerospora sorghi]|uniref:Uncharacterized protein n=1 Tax=Peronosclerospora sorghi TaxID=230839 RepID=A0ACC0W8R0_9STRA|nr:hypothetical protein PsorP6_008417 [Peronosclerospora sorghi]